MTSKYNLDWIFSRGKLLLGRAEALAACVGDQCWALLAGSGVARRGLPIP